MKTAQWSTLALVALASLGLFGAQRLNADENKAFCSCVNEPRGTAAKREACRELMADMSDGEHKARSLACRSALPMPENGPDICFCLKGSVTDPEVAKICDTFVRGEMPRSEIEAIAERCGLR